MWLPQDKRYKAYHEVLIRTISATSATARRPPWEHLRFSPHGFNSLPALSWVLVSVLVKAHLSAACMTCRLMSTRRGLFRDGRGSWWVYQHIYCMTIGPSSFRPSHHRPSSQLMVVKAVTIISVYHSISLLLPIGEFGSASGQYWWPLSGDPSAHWHCDGDGESPPPDKCGMEYPYAGPPHKHTYVGTRYALSVPSSVHW